MNTLAILNIESDITKQIKYEDIMDNFADIQTRKNCKINNKYYSISLLLLYYITYY